MTEKLPQHRILYELLRKHIAEGVYKEGDLLPSENALCRLHNLTRPTVRQALTALANEGYISRHKGKGSIVRILPTGIGILSIHGTTTVLGSKNVKTSIIVKPVLQQWDEPFIFDLSSEEKESGCYKMERLRLVNDFPIFYDENFIPNINVPRFGTRVFENKSLFDTLRQAYQIEINGGEQRLKAIPASEKYSKYLQVLIGHPLLHLERKIETNRQGFYIYSSIYCNTEKHSIYGIF